MSVYMQLGDENVPLRWLETLESVEPLVAEDVGETTMLQDVQDPTSTLGSCPAGVGDSDEDFEREKPRELKDPQLLHLESLRAQRDIHNAFDRRLHGGNSPNCKYSTFACHYIIL